MPTAVREWLRRSPFRSYQFAAGALLTCLSFIGSVITAAQLYEWTLYAPPWAFPTLLLAGAFVCVWAVAQKLGAELAESRKTALSLSETSIAELELYAIELGVGEVSGHTLATRVEHAEALFRAVETKLAQGQLVLVKVFQETSASLLELTAKLYDPSSHVHATAARRVKEATAKFRELVISRPNRL